MQNRILCVLGGESGLNICRTVLCAYLCMIEHDEFSFIEHEENK